MPLVPTPLSTKVYSAVVLPITRTRTFSFSAAQATALFASSLLSSTTKDPYAGAKSSPSETFSSATPMVLPTHILNIASATPPAPTTFALSALPSRISCSTSARLSFVLVAGGISALVASLGACAALAPSAPLAPAPSAPLTLALEPALFSVAAGSTSKTTLPAALNSGLVTFSMSPTAVAKLTSVGGTSRSLKVPLMLSLPPMAPTPKSSCAASAPNRLPTGLPQRSGSPCNLPKYS